MKRAPIDLVNAERPEGDRPASAVAELPEEADTEAESAEDVEAPAAEIAARTVTARAWIGHVTFCCFDKATADLYRSLLS